MTARLLYSYQPTLNFQALAGAGITNSAGVAGLASNRVTLMLAYNLGPFSVNWQSRYYSAEKRGTPGTYFANPPLPAYSLSDANLNYRFTADGHAFNAFFNVQNVFNTPPRLSPSIIFSGIPGFGNPVLGGDDGIGRYFTAGLKFTY
jgi:hypothetical protein